jgi:lysophospholipase L1-like esterase
MKSLLLLMWALLTLGLAIYAGKNFYYKHKHKSDKQETQTNRKITDADIKAKLYRELPVPHGANVFIGDSHTDFFPLSLLARPVVKEGIAGDTTEGVLKRLDKLAEAEPAKVFIEIGHNDLNRNFLPADVANRTFKIAARFPKSKIYINSVFPCSSKNRKGVPFITLDQQLNSILKEQCSKKGYSYIDMYSQFIQNGGIKSKFDCGDQVHLSYAGYAVWANELNRYL